LMGALGMNIPIYPSWLRLIPNPHASSRALHNPSTNSISARILRCIGAFW
jgi:hypothetical protein